MNNSINPNGYRSDDPRYGLSGEELTQYYQNQPPHYFIKALYKPDVFSCLKNVEDKYRDYVESHLNLIHFSGTCFSNKSPEPRGIMCIIDAPDKYLAKLYIKSSIKRTTDLPL